MFPYLLTVEWLTRTSTALSRELATKSFRLDTMHHESAYCNPFVEYSRKKQTTMKTARSNRCSIIHSFEYATAAKAHVRTSSPEVHVRCCSHEFQRNRRATRKKQRMLHEPPWYAGSRQLMHRQTMAGIDAAMSRSCSRRLAGTRLRCVRITSVHARATSHVFVDLRAAANFPRWSKKTRKSA